MSIKSNQTEPYSRRVLRPRTEPKSYAEAPDIVLLPAKINGRQQNGNIDSDTDDEEMPPLIAIKVSLRVRVRVCLCKTEANIGAKTKFTPFFENGTGIISGGNMGA